MDKNNNKGEQPPVNGKTSGRKTKQQKKFGNGDLNPTEEELRRFQKLGKSDSDQEEIKPADSEPVVEQVAESVIEPTAEPTSTVEQTVDSAQEPEPEPKPEPMAEPAVESVPESEPGEEEKGQDLKKEFEQKYPNILKKNRFREPNGNGGWVYIAEYDEKTGEVICRFGKDFGKNGKNKSIPVKIKLAEFDAVLKEYAYEKSAAATEPETQDEAGKEENENRENPLTKEITYDTREKRKKELVEFEEWGGKYWERAAEKFDWKGFDEEQKIGALKIMAEVFVRELIEEQSEFFEKEEAGEKSKEIVKKISEEFTEKINKKN